MAVLDATCKRLTVIQYQTERERRERGREKGEAEGVMKKISRLKSLIFDTVIHGIRLGDSQS